MKNNEKQDFIFEKKLTVFDAWTLSFGGIVGYGAFVMPGTTFLKGAGVAGTLVALQVGAFAMLIISYAYGYMAEKFSTSGGQFIYAERSFGKKHGFLCAWFLGLCYLSIIPMDAEAVSFFFRIIYGRTFQFGLLYSISGFEVYLGEFLVAALVLILFAYIASRGIRLGALIQNVMVIILISGVAIALFGGFFFGEKSEVSNFDPLFYPDERSPVLQIFSVLVTAPWLFVGFDITPQFSEETTFSHHKTKIIMDTCIIASCFIYIALTFLATRGVPSGYVNWVDYVNSLNQQENQSYGALMTFFASYKFLGFTGLFILEASALCAVLTGVLAFYVATSRLLYSMAREEMLPSWFGVLNEHGVPFNAILFCMTISILALLSGRRAMGWTVDIASLGGAIGFAYTSLAARKYSRIENRKDVAIFGTLGFIFSIVFAVLLLVPLPGIVTNILSKESYFILIIWIIMGAIFYRFAVNHQDDERV